MDSIKKALGIVFAILFVLTAVTALVFFNFDRRAFTTETYQKAFASADFYNKLPTDMAKAMLASTTDASQLPVVMRGMNQEAWEAFFRTMLPQETLKVMGDETLNSIFAYLNLQSDSVQISLAPFKASMVSDTGVQAIYSLLETQPDCTLEQLTQITLNLLNNSEIQFCNPPAELIPLLTPVIRGQMQAATFVVPDQLILISAPPQNDPREKLKTARMVMRLSPILPLIFLLFMTIFTVNSFKSWLNWWGISLFMTGGLTAFLGLFGASAFGTIFQSILANTLRVSSFLPALLLDSANALATAMLQALFIPILWQGLLIAFIGLGMAVIGYFISTIRSKHVQQ